MTDTLTLFVGLLLTLFVYSYLVGDNPLYRLAVHLLVGVSAAYAAVVATDRILLPVIRQLMSNPTDAENILWLIPVALSLLLLLKWFRPVGWLGNTPAGILVTIGAAVALVGAVTGTVIPQITSTRSDNAVNTVLIAILSACALLYFQFTVGDREGQTVAIAGWRRVVSMIGQFVILVALGAIFAGVFTTSLVLLIERISFFVNGISSLIGVILL